MIGLVLVCIQVVRGGFRRRLLFVLSCNPHYGRGGLPRYPKLVDSKWWSELALEASGNQVNQAELW